MHSLTILQWTIHRSQEVLLNKFIIRWLLLVESLLKIGEYASDLMLSARVVPDALLLL